MKQEGRLFGLDVGDVRIGVAMTDPLRIIVQPHEVIQVTTVENDVKILAVMFSELEAVGVVVGLPLNQHGEPGPQAQKVLAFIDELKKVTDIPIDTQDERFSTAEVERGLIQANVRRKKRKQVVDKLAAQRILQTYMDRMNR